MAPISNITWPQFATSKGFGAQSHQPGAAAPEISRVRHQPVGGYFNVVFSKLPVPTVPTGVSVNGLAPHPLVVRAPPEGPSFGHFPSPPSVVGGHPHHLFSHSLGNAIGMSASTTTYATTCQLEHLSQPILYHQTAQPAGPGLVGSTTGGADSTAANQCRAQGTYGKRYP